MLSAPLWLPDPYIPASPYEEIAALQPVAMTSGTIIATNNKAAYIPFTFPVDVVLYALYFRSTSATGNYDLGLYTGSFSRITSKGSTAMADARQTLTLPEVRVRCGEVVYAAIAVSNSAATVLRLPLTVVDVPISVAIAEQAAALPLPATMTPVVTVAAVVPIFAFGVR